MSSRILFSIGVFIAILGAIATVIWSSTFGVVALLLLGLLILLVLLLLRRQMARLQKRSLEQLQLSKEYAQTNLRIDQSQSISTKKLIGLLQAQQTSIEILNEKMSAMLPEQTSLSTGHRNSGTF